MRRRNPACVPFGLGLDRHQRQELIVMFASKAEDGQALEAWAAVELSRSDDPAGPLSVSLSILGSTGGGCRYFLFAHTDLERGNRLQPASEDLAWPSLAGMLLAPRSAGEVACAHSEGSPWHRS